MEGCHGLPYLLEEGETLEPIPQRPKRSNPDVAQRELESWDPNKRACHGSFLNAVAIRVPQAQQAPQAYGSFANLESDRYWAEKFKDTCVEENQLLKRRLSMVCHAHLPCKKKIGEKDHRILELSEAHRSAQQERNQLLIEKTVTKSQIAAGETAYRQLQQQLNVSNSHHEKKIEEMQQALSSEQNCAHQRGLENLGLKETLTAKEKELKDNEADFTTWMMDLEEQLDKFKKQIATRMPGIRV